MTSKLSAIETMLMALAKVAPDQAALKAAIDFQVEVLETALLHSQHTDEHVAKVLAHIANMRRAIWG